MFPNPLCDQTVTVYRWFGGTLHRHVVDGCYYGYSDKCLENGRKRQFLLLLPKEIPLAPGDRVLPGVGPESVDWETFLPHAYPGLSQVEKTESFYIDGRFSHWEAS